MPTTTKPTESSTTSSSANIFTLQAHQLDDYWVTLEPILARVDEPAWDPEEAYYAIKAGEAQLWGIWSDEGILGAWVTKIENTHTRRYGIVWLAAGDRLDLGLPLFERYTEPWFWEQGCEFIQVNGRKGWLKALTGYREHGVILTKCRP